MIIDRGQATVWVDAGIIRTARTGGTGFERDALIIKSNPSTGHTKRAGADGAVDPSTPQNGSSRCHHFSLRSLKTSVMKMLFGSNT